MELWDIYDEKGKSTGKKVSKGSIFSKKEYHLAMEAWIINPDNHILIQKRSENCEVLPGIWALTTGRMISGESSLEGCIREIHEELGIDVDKRDCSFIRRIFRNNSNLIWDLYLVRIDMSTENFVLQKDEVDEVKWVTSAEFKQMLKSGILFEYPEIYEVFSYVCQIN